MLLYIETVIFKTTFIVFLIKYHPCPLVLSAHKVDKKYYINFCSKILNKILTEFILIAMTLTRFFHFIYLALK